MRLRNFFLQAANYSSSRSQLVHRFGELMRKIWNPRNFKGQVIISVATNPIAILQGLVILLFGGCGREASACS